jgi:hypothetical protein
VRLALVRENKNIYARRGTEKSQLQPNKRKIIQLNLPEGLENP